MYTHRFGLAAVVATVVLGANLLPAQAQEPGVTLQREITESRIREGTGEDIVRGPQSDLPLDRFVQENEQSFIYPGLPTSAEPRTLVASPSADTLIDEMEAGVNEDSGINEVEQSTSTLRQITRAQGPNSDRQ